MNTTRRSCKSVLPSSPTVLRLKVGGSSKVEAGEKKDSYDNALNATVEEGILPGGGVALPKASLALSTGSSSGNDMPSPSSNAISTVNFDQELGVSLIRRARSQPTRTVLTSVGEKASVVIGTLLNWHGGAHQSVWGLGALSKRAYMRLFFFLFSLCF